MRGARRHLDAAIIDAKHEDGLTRVRSEGRDGPRLVAEVAGLQADVDRLVRERELGRDVELPLVALLHDLHRLGPSLDDLVRRERRGLAALVRAVELGTVDRRTAVVALGRRPYFFLQNLPLLEYLFRPFVYLHK